MTRPGASGTVRVGDLLVPYRVVTAPRSRRVRLRVGAEPVVEILVPTGWRSGDIGALLLPSQGWIARHLGRAREEEGIVRQVGNGVAIPLHGVDRRVVLKPSVDRPAVVIESDRIVVTGEGDPRHVLHAWLVQCATVEMREQVDRWAARMQVEYRAVAIRDQKTRWGSCSTRGTLSFSWRLIMAPPTVLQYVVIHELAHVLKPNHSPEFWAIVQRFCPDQQQHRRWLRENGRRLAAVLTA